MNGAGRDDVTTVESQSVPRMHESFEVRESELLIENACKKLIHPTACLSEAVDALWAGDVSAEEQPELMSRAIFIGLQCWMSLRKPLAIHALDLDQAAESAAAAEF